jgi:ABC-type lipoprotein export system ATPase subunit
VIVFQRLNRERGLTVVFVTHHVRFAQRAGGVVYLAQRRITSDETVSEPLLAAALPGTSHENGSK